MFDRADRGTRKRLCNLVGMEEELRRLSTTPEKVTPEAVFELQEIIVPAQGLLVGYSIAETESWGAEETRAVVAHAEEVC